jgi:hypothetical protein
MMRPNKIGWFIVAFFFIGGVIFTILIPRIWIGEIWIAVSLAVAAYYVLMNRRADRAEKLKREGIPGQAQILEATQTGMYVNEQPRVRLKLRIEAPGVTSFESEDTYTVPLIALGALTSGRMLQVYLDRADTSRFTIDWFGGGVSPSPAFAGFSGGSSIDLDASPEAREAVLDTLRSHGIDLEGTIDLRGNPAVRAAVLDALARHGVDVAHGVAAAAPGISVEPSATPLDRLQKLKELEDGGLITEREFEQQKARILDSI